MEAFGLIVGLGFVAIGIFMILRPAEALRGFYWASTKPLLPVELVAMRCIGCVFVVFSVFFSVKLLSEVLA